MQLDSKKISRISSCKLNENEFLVKSKNLKKQSNKKKPLTIELKQKLWKDQSNF